MVGAVNLKYVFQERREDFPGWHSTSLVGTVVENLPANAGARVQGLVREDPTCRGATKPVRHNY